VLYKCTNAAAATASNAMLWADNFWRQLCLGTDMPPDGDDDDVEFICIALIKLSSDALMAHKQCSGL